MRQKIYPIILVSQNMAINCTKIALMGDENCIELRGKSRLYKRALINQSLTIPRYNEHFGKFPLRFVISRFSI